MFTWEDGCCILEAVEALEAPPERGALPRMATLRRVWQAHDKRLPKDRARPQGKAHRVRYMGRAP